MAGIESSLSSLPPVSCTSDILVHTTFHGSIAGYKLELLRENIEPELVCQLCDGMLNEPLETSCGHAFCSACIESFSLQKSEKMVCPASDCSEQLPSVSELKPGNILAKLVNKQIMRCPFQSKGCSWSGYCDEIDSHVDSCLQPEPTWELVQQLASQISKLAIENTHLLRRVGYLERDIQSKDKSAFYWKIHHVSKAVRVGSELFSPTFMTGSCGYQACLHVYMGGNSFGKGTHISLYLQLQLGTNNDILPWPVKCNFSISLINFTKDEDHFALIGRTEFDGTGKGVGYPKFFSSKDLFKTETDIRFVNNDCLILKCSLTPDSHIANLK